MSFDENAPRTVRDMIEPAIKKAGGWVNTHAHADRAFTLSPEILEMRRTHSLQQKWDALDRLKSESTEESEPPSKAARNARRSFAERQTGAREKVSPTVKSSK